MEDIPTCILALDPGTVNLGLAVLSQEGQLIHGEHLTPTCDSLAPYASLHDPLARWSKLLFALVRLYSPIVIAYEDFTWREEVERFRPDGTRSFGRRSGINHPAMWGLIGIIRSLESAYGQPIVVAYSTEWWTCELSGRLALDKESRQVLIEQRLGQSIAQGYGRHISDAAGCGLVALDHWHAATRQGVSLREFHAQRRESWRPRQVRTAGRRH